MSGSSSFACSVVAARFVGKDNAASFQGTLRAAVASHGVPEKLFVDYAEENAKPINRFLPWRATIHAA